MGANILDSSALIHASWFQSDKLTWRWACVVVDQDVWI
jgi:hypothetical protein